MKLIQIIAQARQTAKRISDHSNEVAANNSFLSWFGMGSSDPNNTFSGAEPEESGECLKKTHEFLDRALENLCQIFKVSQFDDGSFTRCQKKVLDVNVAFLGLCS